jgi:hypothetical protein
MRRPKVGSPWDPDDPLRDGEGWQVHLPHQCDAWKIAGGDYDGVPHAAAVAALERFIAEAQVALAALRAEREVDGDG